MGTLIQALFEVALLIFAALQFSSAHTVMMMMTMMIIIINTTCQSAEQRGPYLRARGTLPPTASNARTISKSETGNGPHILSTFGAKENYLRKVFYYVITLVCCIIIIIG